MGADAFLGKPFSEEELIAIINNLLRLKSKEKLLQTALSDLQETNIQNELKAKELILSQETSLKELLQELTHDLKTPLASMFSITQNLHHSQKTTSNEKRQQLAILSREIQYFQKLLEDLLFLSGLITSNSKNNHEAFNISNIILDIAEIIEEQNSIEITVDCSDDFSYFGDRFLFNRMIRNLLDNAAKYATKTIIIKAYIKNKLFFIEVIDDGPGFDPANIKNYGQKRSSRIVQKNDRSSTIKTSESQINISLGLGSVIVNNIVQKFQGEITIENRAEGGAIITISLPIDKLHIVSSAS